MFPSIHFTVSRWLRTSSVRLFQQVLVSQGMPHGYRHAFACFQRQNVGAHTCTPLSPDTPFSLTDPNPLLTLSSSPSRPNCLSTIPAHSSRNCVPRPTRRKHVPVGGAKAFASRGSPAVICKRRGRGPNRSPAPLGFKPRRDEGRARLHRPTRRRRPRSRQNISVARRRGRFHGNHDPRRSLDPSQARRGQRTHSNHAGPS